MKNITDYTVPRLKAEWSVEGKLCQRPAEGTRGLGQWEVDHVIGMDDRVGSWREQGETSGKGVSLRKTVWTGVCQMWGVRMLLGTLLASPSFSAVILDDSPHLHTSRNWHILLPLSVIPFPFSSLVFQDSAPNSSPEGPLTPQSQ